MNSSMACPDASELRRFADGSLESEPRRQVAEHLRLCEKCRDALASAAQSQGATPDITRATDGEPVAETRPWEAEVDVDSDIDLGFLLPSGNDRALGQIGKYEVRGLLGRGGMGVVFQAFDDSLHRTVAIKVLAPELASNAKARRRFIREGRAAAAINHSNVVTIHAVDEQNGMPYLVMEHVAGCSLRDRIRRAPRLEMIDIVRIGAQIASGLAAAHAQGVIHRDIKPSNVLLEDGVDRVHAAGAKCGVAVIDRAIGSEESPVSVRGCAFDDDYIGLAVLGRQDSPVSWLRVEQCRFRMPGKGVALTMEQAVEQVSVSHCVFAGGGGASGVHIDKNSRHVSVVNNTFFQTSDWVGLNADAVVASVSVRRNLVLESKFLLHGGSELQHVIDVCLRDNWWEFAAGADDAEVRAVCAPRVPMAQIPVASRDSASAEFLRPQPGSPLTELPEAGGATYVGAIPPPPGRRPPN